MLASFSLAVAVKIDGAPLWLPDALLIFLVLGRSGRAWVFSLAAGAAGILLACLLVSGAFLALAAFVVAASILHAAAARFLLLYFARDAVRLTNAAALVHLLLWTALVSPIAGAVVMAGAAAISAEALPAMQGFLPWWTGSAIGTAILLPFLLALVHSAPTDFGLIARRRWELALVLALVLLVTAIARQATGGFPLLLGLPVVLWAALRLDFRMTSLLCAVLALLPLVTAALQLWPFYDERYGVAPAEEQQAYLLAIILPALFASLITEEQRAGDRARQTALQALRAVMDAVPLAIVTLARDGKVKLWSRGAERIFGWRRADVEGAEPPFVTPDSAAHDQSVRQRVLAGNEIQSQPAQRQIQGGALRELLLSAVPQRDADGEITGIISAMEDVTDRRHMEASREEQCARMAAILDAVADPIITSDENGAITSFPRAAETVFGYSAAEAIGQNLRILMPDPDSSRHDAYLRRYRETGVKRIIGTKRQVTALRKDGRTFPAEIAISEAWLDGRRIFAALVRDLSLASTAPSGQQPASSETAKFLSRITHDLRQPLHALTLMTGALERRVEDAETREIVDDLSRIVRSTQATFENLAEWTRVESGLVGAASANVPAQDVLAALAQEFTPEAVRRNLAFRSVATRATIACDPALVRRILRQVLDNAVKFTVEGKILLGARRHGSRVRLIVADTGCGIPAHQQDAVFAEYNQLDAGREAGGLGLGLAIARRLAEIGGVTIGIRSVAGRGSLFWVEVPRA